MILKDWNKFKEEDPDQQIFCLWGRQTGIEDQIRQLRTSKGNFRKMIIVPTRAEYLRRHSHEGFFFQQRFQSVYSSQGETVEDVIHKQAESLNSGKLRSHIGLFHLEKIWSKPLLQLSSGEWQRFSLCLSLLQRPDILIAPHGLNGLDADWQQRIPQILSDHFQEVQMIVFTSDQPIMHPAIQNIPLDQNENLSENMIPPEPEKPSDSLMTSFRDYHNQLRHKEIKKEIIRMTDVNIRYGNNQILDHVNWIVQAGEKWNIRGPNGAGKSTLISLVNADNPQGYSQKIKIFGEPFGRHSIWERKARISYFSSDYFQYYRSAGKTAEAVVREHLKTPYLDTPQPPENLLISMAEYFDVAECWDQPFSSLDKTLRQQILLLAAYAKSSELLMLDEPYHDFDRMRIRKNNLFLETVQENLVQTVIFVTHRGDHMPAFLNRFLEIDEGRAKEIFL